MSLHPHSGDELRLRLTPEAAESLRAAAAALRRSTSDFVLESALARADETLAERRSFGLSAERWHAFHEALDAEPRPLPRLRRLLAEPSPFDA